MEYLKSIELTEPVICILGKVFNGTGESESDNRYTYIPIMVFVMAFEERYLMVQGVFFNWYPP